MKKFCFLVVLILLVALFCANGIAVAETSDNYRNTKAYELTKEICAYPRKAGIDKDGAVQTYLINKFNEALGKDVAVKQTFTYGNSAEYCNVVAKIDRSSVSDKQIIIGAHYDSDGEGAADNACGVAALIITMQNFARSANDLPCSVVFVAFDAEELGLLGSREYVSQMSEEQIENTLVMFNMDSIANGDNLYLWCENKRTSLADLIVSKTDKIVEKPYAKGTYNLPDFYGYGYSETPQNTDQTPFRLAGIPTALFFSGTYSAEPWSYAESSDVNKCVMNTSKDTFENLEKNNGAEFVAKIEATVDAVTSSVLSENFAEVAESQRSQLVNLSVWYNTWWARLIVFGLLIIIVILAVLHYRKLQKQSILGTAEVKANNVFSQPDAEEIFTFKK